MTKTTSCACTRVRERSPKRKHGKLSAAISKKGSILVHDDEQGHKKLVNNLSLTIKVHPAKELKGIADESNPLNPVNRIHMLLQEFLHSHNSFIQWTKLQEQNFNRLILLNIGKLEAEMQ